MRGDTNLFLLNCRRLALGAVGVLAILLGLLTVSSGQISASSNMSPSLAPCPSWDIPNVPNNPSGGNVLVGISVAAPDQIWAVGYTYTSETDETLAMRWNGTAWEIVPSPNPGPPGTNFFQDVVAFSANDVWASISAGSGEKPIPYLVHWDGQAWTTATLPALDPAGADLYAMAASGPNDIWAVGSVGCIECKTERSIALHYNGVDWQVKPTLSGEFADAFFGVTSRAPNDAWFVGYQFTVLGVRPFVIHWNGTDMVKVETDRLGGNNNYLHDVIAVSDTEVWIVGQTGSPKAQRLIMRGNEAGFAIVSPPEISAEGSVLLAIDGNVPNDLWAAGYFIASGQRRVLMLHYDGNAWTQAQYPDPGEGASFYDMEVGPNGDVHATGYVNKSGVANSLVESYTDKCAAPPPTPTNPPAPPTATSIPTATSTPVPVVPVPGSNSRAFPETGKSVGGLFLAYWDTNGGLAQQGFPISDPVGEISPLDGKPYTVQYFERAVFEYHPENQAPYNVLLSQLGTFQYKKKYPAGAPGQTPNNSAGSVLFPETGYRVGGKFLDYWQMNGGLAQQGFPISDEFQEVSDLDGKTYTVQYFERAVFEMHPENQAPYDVLLSQLGTFRYRELYEPKSAFVLK